MFLMVRCFHAEALRPSIDFLSRCRFTLKNESKILENRRKSEQNFKLHPVSAWKTIRDDFLTIFESILDPKSEENRSKIDADWDEHSKMIGRGLKESLGTHLEPS